MKKNEIVPDSIVPTPEEANIEEETKSKKKKKDPRQKLKFRTLENDISYKAPLSYRHLRILGWVFLAISTIGMAFTLASSLDKSGTFDYSTGQSVISLFSSFPFVLFLLANFGIILRNRKNFKYLFIFYGGVMLALYVIANLAVLHYVYGTARTINPEVSFQDVSLVTGTLLMTLGNSGYMFNLFVDLFLCVLTVYFTFYTPKNKFFQGKKIIIFRLFVIIPIAYEVASLIIKQNVLLGYMFVPTYVFFLLTSKPPLTFVAFFIITLILKIREHKFLKLYNYDYDLLDEQMSTNAHSFRTSITIAIVFLIISHVDILVMLIYMVAQIVTFAQQGTLDDDSFLLAFEVSQRIGIGGSAPLFLVAPITLLYSYTKTHTNKKFDSLLPFIGIGLVAFVMIESIYLALRFTGLQSLAEILNE